MYQVFFVKYNDPIYIKLEKLDIMIRLTSQANIAQVLSELKVDNLIAWLSRKWRFFPRTLTAGNGLSPKSAPKY